MVTPAAKLSQQFWACFRYSLHTLTSVLARCKLWKGYKKKKKSPPKTLSHLSQSHHSSTNSSLFHRGIRKADALLITTRMGCLSPHKPYHMDSFVFPTFPHVGRMSLNSFYYNYQQNNTSGTFMGVWLAILELKTVSQTTYQWKCTEGMIPTYYLVINLQSQHMQNTWQTEGQAVTLFSELALLILQNTEETNYI